MQASTSIYNTLLSDNVDVLLDDRKDRAGVKFKDADLIGYPLRITVSKNTSESDDLEIRVRKTGETINCPISEVLITVQDWLAQL